MTLKKNRKPHLKHMKWLLKEKKTKKDTYFEKLVMKKEELILSLVFPVDGKGIPSG